MLRHELLCLSSDSKGSLEKSKFELGERMSNEAVNINGEEYKKVRNLIFVIFSNRPKVRIPTDNTLKSKLVLIKLFKVGLPLYSFI